MLMTIHKCPAMGHLNKKSQLSSNIHLYPASHSFHSPEWLNNDRCIKSANENGNNGPFRIRNLRTISAQLHVLNK